MSLTPSVEVQGRLGAFRVLTTRPACRLLLALADGPLDLTTLAARAGYSKAYACDRLKALLLLGAVAARRDGHRAVYRINRGRRETPARAVLRALGIVP